MGLGKFLSNILNHLPINISTLGKFNHIISCGRQAVKTIDLGEYRRPHGVTWLSDGKHVAVTAEGSVVPLVQIVGQDGSEITGPAFGPSLERLYFSSQRGPEGLDLLGMSGITYEVTGPFFV